MEKDVSFFLLNKPFKKCVPFKGMVIIMTLENLLAPRILHAKYQCIPVVHEKIFEDLSTFSLFCPKRGQPLYLNKSESPSSKHVSCQVWLKLA